MFKTQQHEKPNLKMSQTLNRHLKENIHIINKHIKICSKSRHQANANWNNKIPLSTYLNDQNPEHYQYQMLVKSWNNRNSDTLQFEMSKGTVILEEMGRKPKPREIRDTLKSLLPRARHSWTLVSMHFWSKQGRNF